MSTSIYNVGHYCIKVIIIMECELFGIKVIRFAEVLIGFGNLGNLEMVIGVAKSNYDCHPNTLRDPSFTSRLLICSLDTPIILYISKLIQLLYIQYYTVKSHTYIIHINRCTCMHRIQCTSKKEERRRIYLI